MTHDEVHKHRIHCFAKWVWPRRNEYAPKEEDGRKWLWSEIFFRRTQQTLERYAADHRK